jgi:hypothetical protein
VVKQQTQLKGNIGGNRGDVAESFFVNQEDTPIGLAYFDGEKMCKMDEQQRQSSHQNNRCCRVRFKNTHPTIIKLLNYLKSALIG